MKPKDNCVITTDVKTVLTGLIEQLQPSSISILTDTNTHLHCYPIIKDALPDHTVITIKPGESEKNIYVTQTIWEALTNQQVDRKGLLINLGGGVLGDMGGFCAATYKRGIEFILIPTTLLAQVDASIGGKLAIDFKNFKNHIGVFQESYCTVIDQIFLRTLPKSEIRSGFAEIIKHCLIADGPKWQNICGRNLEEQHWDELVRHSVSIKQKITSEDPKESGLRKILNFGHTIGHAVESASLQSSNHLLHGEAIAIGMIAESFIAMKKEMISPAALSEITTFILSVFGHHSLKDSNASLTSLILQDKKNQNKKILMALPDGIGSCKWDVETTVQEIYDALDYYRGLKK